MTIAADILPVLGFEYGDASYTSITESDWIALLNMAIRDVISARPDAYTQVKVLTLDAGTRQTIPDGDIRLVQLTRNMESDGTTPGNAIVGPWPKESIDAAEPTWETNSGATTVTGYSWTEALPRDFLVYPSVAAGVKVEAVVATLPTELAATSDSIALGAQFWPAICDFAMSYAYSRDHERSPSFARADRHHNRALQRLGVKSSGDVSVEPAVAEQRE